MNERRARSALVLASVLFLALGAVLSESVGTWHEELSVHVSRGTGVLELRGRAIVVRDRCTGDARWASSHGRPRLAMCVQGLTFPVMGDSYFSGIYYWPFAAAWPLTHGDAFLLRKVALVFGLIDLVLLYVLVSRLRDETSAALVVLMAGVSSPFLYTHTILTHYEVLPWLFLCAAMLVIGPREKRRSTGRVIGAAALIAAAVLANVKAIFLLAPLVALVLARHRGWLRSIAPRAYVGSALAAALVTAPMWCFALTDPDRGFGAQIDRRADTLLARLDPLLVPREVLNLFTFGTDVGAYFSSAGGLAHPILLVLAACAFGWALFHLLRWLRGKEADLLGVIGGASLFFYLFVGVLLYGQRPPANYAPLNVIYPMTWGGALLALLRRVPKPYSRAVSILAVLAVIGGGSALMIVRSADARSLALPMNAPAQRALGARLRRQHGATVVTTTYNLSGVVDSLAGDHVRSIAADPVLAPCLRGSADRDACLEERMTAILDAVDRPFVLVPAVATMIDEPGVDRIAPALERAASAHGLRAQRVARFRSDAGTAVLDLWRVAP